MTHTDMIRNLEKFLTNNNIHFCVEHSALNYNRPTSVSYHLMRGNKAVTVHVSEHSYPSFQKILQAFS